MTTKVKKKGALAYQEAPQRKNRAERRSRSLRDSLPLKSTNPSQETEECSWPKMNLAFPPSQKNPAACNNLDFRTQKKFSFISCKDLDHCHVYSTTAVHFQPEGKGWGAERES